jgi:segregation and condensation protein A
VDKYELKLDEFQGPLEKLLELIEAKKLDITRLSLAEVTADFLAYVRTLTEIDPRALADFITVASRLILIKSHAILPQFELSEEEEEDIRDLEARLRLYREFRIAENHITDLWTGDNTYAREYLTDFPPGFYLTEPVKPQDLQKVMARLYEELQAFIPKTEERTVKLISLEEKIKEMIERVDRVLKTSFNDITEGREKSEIIVLFLALLHLLKESSIEIQQDGVFSEIKITSNNGRSESTS